MIKKSMQTLIKTIHDLWMYYIQLAMNSTLINITKGLNKQLLS